MSVEGFSINGVVHKYDYEALDNVPTSFCPLKSNEDCISRILDIAYSYCGVGVTYQSNNGPFYSSSSNWTGIQCSQFINTILQGVYYKKSKLYSSSNTNERLDGYCTLVDIEPFKSSSSGCMDASDLAEFAAQNGMLFKTKQFKDTRPGDVVFFAYANSDPSNWMNITHVAMVIERNGHETKVLGAGTIGNYNNMVSATYYPGASTDAVRIQVVSNDEADYWDTGSGLVGYARIPLFYAFPPRDPEAYPTDTSDSALAHISDGADGIPVKSLVLDLDYASGGISSVKFTHCRKNLVRLSGTNSTAYGMKYTFDYDAGTLTLNGKRSANGTWALASLSLPLGTYAISCKNETDDFYLRVTEDGTRIAWGGGPSSFTVESGHTYALDLFVRGDVQATNLVLTPMIVVGSTADNNAEPFEGLITEIDLSQLSDTIYGGTLDLINGVLTSTKASDGTALATPVKYNLAKYPVRTYYGVNNIWSDNGDTAIEYRADPTLYINARIGG